MAKINKQIVKRTALMRRIVSQMLFGPKQRFDQTAVLFCPNVVSPFFWTNFGVGGHANCWLEAGHRDHGLIAA